MSTSTQTIDPAVSAGSRTSAAFQSVTGWLDRLPPLRGSLLVTVILLCAYLPTASFELPMSNDALSTALAAGRLASDGDLNLDDFVDERQRLELWLVETDGRFVTDRFPGTILHAVPFYWVADRLGVSDLSETDATLFPFGPASAAAAFASTAAMGLLFLALRRIASGSAAFVAALAGGLATSTWSVSADQLWTHGPGQLWLALAMLALASGRLARGGLGFAVSILVRPPNAFAAAGAGLYESWGRRSLKPAFFVGAAASAGVAALLLYNTVVFAESSPAGGAAVATGGYGMYPADQLSAMSSLGYARNVAGTLFSPHRGILVGSPFLVLLLPGLRRAWKASPSWVRASAVGGVAQLAAQLAATNYTGGIATFSYRFPLEMLTLAAPLLLLSYQQWTARTERRRVAFVGLLLGAVAIQATGASLNLVW